MCLCPITRTPNLGFREINNFGRPFHDNHITTCILSLSPLYLELKENFKKYIHFTCFTPKFTIFSPYPTVDSYKIWKKDLEENEGRQPRSPKRLR